MLASRTAQELNLAGVGSTLNVTGHVVRRLVDMFETIYVHHQLPAWSQNLTAKVARKPKMHLVDSGLAALLTGVDAERLTQPGAPFAGALLETFVAGELCRQLTWSDTEARAYHFRGRDGAKVDIVLERPSGEIVGVEVKAAPDFDASDLRGLRLMRDRLGSAFVCGVLIHCGDAVQQVDERIWALPVNALWTEPPA